MVTLGYNDIDYMTRALKSSVRVLISHIICSDVEHIIGFTPTSSHFSSFSVEHISGE